MKCNSCIREADCSRVVCYCGAYHWGTPLMRKEELTCWGPTFPVGPEGCGFYEEDGTRYAPCPRCSFPWIEYIVQGKRIWGVCYQCGYRED